MYIQEDTRPSIRDITFITFNAKKNVLVTSHIVKGRGEFRSNSLFIGSKKSYLSSSINKEADEIRESTKFAERNGCKSPDASQPSCLSPPSPTTLLPLTKNTTY